MVVFSHGTAVCVSVEGSYAYNTKSITCASCQYGASSCKHVTCVLGLLKTQSPPTALGGINTAQIWVILLQVISSHPMDIYPSSARDTKDDTRFNIQNGLAYLYPQSHCSCPKCGELSWSDPFVVRDSFVVTDTVFYPAKGTTNMSLRSEIHIALYPQFSAESAPHLDAKEKSIMMTVRHGHVFCGVRGTSETTITKHGSTWYIGMAHVPRHRVHTFEKSHFHFQFQSAPSFVTTTK